MKRPWGWRQVFRFPVSHEQMERDVEDELSFHLESLEQRMQDSGLEGSEAKKAAIARFGPLDRIREQCQAIGRSQVRRLKLREAVADLIRDLGIALRRLRRRPAAAVTAVWVLALGLGATTALFAALWAVVLKPLPLPDSERVVWSTGWDRGRETPLSPGMLALWQKSLGFSALAGLWERQVTLSQASDGAAGQTAKALNALLASPEIFPVLGLEMRAGRAFLPSEAQSGAEPVVVLSHSLWRRQLGGREGVVGSAVVLDGVPHTVVGVLPEVVESLSFDHDLWLPLVLGADQANNYGSRYLQAVGRLAPERSGRTGRHQVQAQLDAMLAGRDLRTEAGGPLLRSRLQTFREHLGGDYRGRLQRLLAAALCVLLITCGHVSILLLAQGAARRRELAVRSALGAGRNRLLRQLLAESLLLGLLGALLGLVFAKWGLTLLQHWLPASVPRLAGAGLAPQVLLFGLVLGLLACVLAALLPAWQATRRRPHSLAAAGAGLARQHSLLLQGFVALQVALSLVLLSASSHFLSGALQLERSELGFRAQGLLSARLQVGPSMASSLTEAVPIYRRVAERAAAMPGVDGVTLASKLPLMGGSAGLDFSIQDRPDLPAVQSRIRLAEPGYLGVLGVPLLAGEDLWDRSGERVLVVNRSLARRLGVEPAQLLGQSLVSSGYGFVDEGGTPLPWRVVGVCDDVRDQDLLAGDAPAVYLPLGVAPDPPWSWTERQMFLVLRSNLDPAALARPLVRTLALAQPGLPVFGVEPLSDRVASNKSQRRLVALLMGALGLAGLVLAAIGLYGATVFMVNQRRREMGVRMALGADGGAVAGQVIRRGLRPVLVGVVSGAALALSFASLASSLLPAYGDDASLHGGASVTLATVVLLLVARLALGGPAREAASLDPARVLRDS